MLVDRGSRLRAVALQLRLHVFDEPLPRPVFSCILGFSLAPCSPLGTHDLARGPVGLIPTDRGSIAVAVIGEGHVTRPIAVVSLWLSSGGACDPTDRGSIAVVVIGGCM